MSADTLKPFTNTLEYTLKEKILLGVMGLVLVPVRTAFVAGICSVYFCWGAVLMVQSGWSGADAAQRNRQPLKAAYAEARHNYLRGLGHLLARALGLHITIRGGQATKEEAPLLVAAASTSVMDSLLGLIFSCSMLEPDENELLPPIWPAQQLAQDFYVDWTCRESRAQAKAILELRLKSSSEPWPQVLIFPEGATGNGTCLLRFEKDCLSAGVPVQPVVVRYRMAPGKNYTACTGDVHPLLSLLLVMSNPWTYMDVEFLPVYTPSQEEREDAVLLAINLQKLMADRLGVPASNITAH
jgi:1-acyl-sn-glycerol-3-phosphate acyltransferase